MLYNHTWTTTASTNIPRLGRRHTCILRTTNTPWYDAIRTHCEWLLYWLSGGGGVWHYRLQSILWYIYLWFEGYTYVKCFEYNMENGKIFTFFFFFFLIFTVKYLNIHICEKQKPTIKMTISHINPLACCIFNVCDLYALFM